MRLFHVLSRLLLGTCLVLLGCTLSTAQQPASNRAAIIEQLRGGNNQQALSLATEALKTNPHDCPVRSLQAVAFTALGQPVSALQSFRKVLVDCPDYLPALEGSAQIEFARQSAETIPLLDRILSRQPGNATAHSMLAVMLRSEDKCPEALPHFEASQSLFATRPDILEAYGSCLARTGNLKAALAQYLSLLQSSPKDEIRYDVALLQWKTQAINEALVTLAPLLDARQNEAAFRLASKLYEVRGDTPRAVELLRTAILMAPEKQDNYLDFAEIAFNHKSFQVGIDILNTGLGRLPLAAPLYVARGVLEVQLSQADAAVSDFEQAHRLDPKLSLAVDAVGIMQTQQHQPGDSLALFREQAKRHPDDALLQYLLAEQLSESETDGGGNLAEAIAAAKQAAALDTRYQAAHDLLAVLYLRAKQPRLAIEAAEHALAQDPEDQDALYHEIIARRQLGETSLLPALLARFNDVRKANQHKQQDLDRYRLQDVVTH